MVHQVLIGDAGFLREFLEILDGIRIDPDGNGLLELLYVRVLY